MGVLFVYENSAFRRCLLVLTPIYLHMEMEEPGEWSERSRIVCVRKIRLFIIATFALGFVFGGRDPGIRSVMGLGTAQRNISAALVVGVQNFTDPNVITTLLVGAILLLLLLMPAARQLGSRAQAPTPVAEPAAGS